MTVGREAEIAARLEEMNAMGMWEWRLHSFDGLHLRLAGGQDMDQAHFAQATFRDTSFVCCPVRMKHPRFRLATAHEARTSGAAAARAPGDFVIAIDCEADNTFEHVAFIAAASVELAQGVFRY